MSTKTVIAVCVSTLLLVWQPTRAADSFDTDGDGFDDNSDNCTLVFNPDQADTDGDYFGNLCDADFNNDHVINNLDLGIMAQNFFSSEPPTDLTVDGITNFPDLDLLRSMYLSNPGPTATNPDQPPCNCTFSANCNAGEICNVGPDWFTEDICVWRRPIPNSVGTGCSTEANQTTGDWTPDLCDGLCTSASAGSTIGLENPDLVARTIAYWGDAMIEPSAGGGGPLDSALAARASAMQFSADHVPVALGRYTADVLAMATGEAFHSLFNDWESQPEDGSLRVVSLAGDACRITTAQLTVQALAAEIRVPRSAAGFMHGVADVCPNWQQMFATQCESGPGALDCAIQFITAQAYFLRTPPVIEPLRATKLMDLLKNKRNVALPD